MLLIEDEPAYANLLRNYLADQKEAFVISHAMTLEQGLTHLQHASFDVLVVDLHLPDASGLSTLVKTLNAAPKLPIVVMTGLADEALGIQAVAQGAQDYLLKETINGETLARALRYSLERHRLLLKLEQKVQAVEGSFYKLVQHNVDSMLILSSDGTIIFPNAAATQLFGKSEEDLLGTSFDFPLKLGEATELEIIRSRGDSSIVEMRLVNMIWQGEDVYLASLRDISSRKQFEMQLEHQAHHDTLTGLPNRRYVEWYFNEWTRHHAYDERQLAFIYFDLNRFKQVNDSLGHPVGDELLKQVARRLASIKRGHDVVARMGGDEFALLVAVVNAQEAALAAERITATLRESFGVLGHDLRISASLGIALWSTNETFSDLLRRADVAMYHAKATNTPYIFYDTDTDLRFNAQVWIENELTSVLEKDGLELHYQPIVCASTGAWTSAEALLRWQHPEKGMVSPMSFIPIAEDMGLMPKLDRWVISRAIREAAAGQFSVAVNLSAQSLQSDRVFEDVMAALVANHLAPTSLCLEVTEHALVSTGNALTTLKQFHDHGIQIALDDFGTGYSSLAYLDSYPLSALKIDRHFVASSLHRPKTMAITKSILRLASDLGLKTVVEGVETPEERERFEQLGCSFIQGFLTGEPMPLANFSHERLLQLS